MIRQSRQLPLFRRQPIDDGITMGIRETNSIDHAVGERIKVRRNEMGLSQESLAVKLDISSHQVVKYEKGLNRIASSRLQQVAVVLGVPVGYFFDDHVSTSDELLGFCASAEGQSLITAFRRIRRGPIRDRIIHLVEALALTYDKGTLYVEQ